jgi:hypothetical protein
MSRLILLEALVKCKKPFGRYWELMSPAEQQELQAFIRDTHHLDTEGLAEAARTFKGCTWAKELLWALVDAEDLGNG